MVSDRRRFSKIGLLALMLVVVLGATGIAAVVSDIDDANRSDGGGIALDIASVDPDGDTLVVGHRSGGVVDAHDFVLAVSVGGRTVSWDGSTARSDELAPGDRIVADLDSGQVWWGVDTDARPTWSEPSNGTAVDVEPGDTVRVRLVVRMTDRPLADLNETA
jgi:hypothetical protein